MSVHYPTIADIIGPALRVYVADGSFHRLTNNLWAPKISGKASKVIGGVMACGLNLQHPTPGQWQEARTHVQQAIINGHKPCQVCFEAAL